MEIIDGYIEDEYIQGYGKTSSIEISDDEVLELNKFINKKVLINNIFDITLIIFSIIYFTFIIYSIESMGIMLYIASAFPIFFILRIVGYIIKPYTNREKVDYKGIYHLYCQESYGNVEIIIDYGSPNIYYTLLDKNLTLRKIKDGEINYNELNENLIYLAKNKRGRKESKEDKPTINLNR